MAVRIAAIIDKMSDVFGGMASYATLLACLISAANAFMRYVFNYSTNGWIEMQWYLFGAIVFLGAPYTLKVNEHVRVDIFYSSASSRSRLLIDIVGMLLFLLPFSIYMTWLSWPVFWDSFTVSEMSPNPGGLLRWPAKLLLPLGFTLLTLQGIAELTKRILMLSGRIPVSVQYEKALQ